MEGVRSKYTNLQYSGAFTSANKIAQLENLNKRRVQAKLHESKTYNLHFPFSKRKVKRRVTYAPYMHAFWQADLKHTPHPKSNYNKHYILFCIDVLSKKLYVEPIKTKTADDVIKAFKVIFAKADAIPDNIETDYGNEFFSRKTRKFFKDNGINHYKRFTPIKAGNVERVQRTLFDLIARYMTENNTKRFIHKLQTFVDIYQNTYHRMIKRTPASVNKDTQWLVWETLYGKPEKKVHAKYNVGDNVYPILEKPTFRKGYLQHFKETLHEIIQVTQTNPPMYRIRNLETGKIVQRRYYNEELVRQK